MILTPDQRLRVFVSSTLQELAAERAAVRDAIAGLQLYAGALRARRSPPPAAGAVSRVPRAEPRLRGDLRGELRLGRARREHLRHRGRVRAVPRAPEAALREGAGSRDASRAWRRCSRASRPTALRPTSRTPRPRSSRASSRRTSRSSSRNGSTWPPSRRRLPPRATLPAPRTSFVGRRLELAWHRGADRPAARGSSP